MVEAVIEEVTASKSSVATLLGAKKKEAPVHDNPSNRVPNEEIVTDPKDAPGLAIPPPLQILSPAGDLDVLISSRQLNPSPERLPESLKEAAEGNDTNLDTGRLDLNHNNISKGADDDKHTQNDLVRDKANLKESVTKSNKGSETFNAVKVDEFDDNDKVTKSAPKWQPDQYKNYINK